jgi:predicted TIM-barrel fold metal-dependent hydrolase
VELDKLAQRTGPRFADSVASRELGNVDLRLKYMDANSVDVQVLHNTMFIESVADRPAVEVALYKAWNRWLADIWKQRKGRLRWSCMAPVLSMSDALDQIRFAKENGACAMLMRWFLSIVRTRDRRRNE